MMTDILSSPELKIKEGTGLGTTGGGGRSDDGWGGSDSTHQGNGPPEHSRYLWPPYRLATWLGLASITMVFAGLSSAYFFRWATATDWNPVPLPRMALWNTLVLLCSSVTLAFSRRSRKSHRRRGVLNGLFLTLILGLAFIFGQFTIWRELATQGVYLSSSPHGSFCYLMMGTHAVHVLGGLLLLGIAFYRNWKGGILNGKAIAILDVVTIYWHFLTGLWIYLFLLLFFFGR